MPTIRNIDNDHGHGGDADPSSNTHVQDQPENGTSTLQGLTSSTQEMQSRTPSSFAERQHVSTPAPIRQSVLGEVYQRIQDLQSLLAERGHVAPQRYDTGNVHGEPKTPMTGVTMLGGDEKNDDISSLKSRSTRSPSPMLVQRPTMRDYGSRRSRSRSPRRRNRRSSGHRVHYSRRRRSITPPPQPMPIIIQQSRSRSRSRSPPRPIIIQSPRSPTPPQTVIIPQSTRYGYDDQNYTTVTNHTSRTTRELESTIEDFSSMIIVAAFLASVTLAILTLAHDILTKGSSPPSSSLANTLNTIVQIFGSLSLSFNISVAIIAGSAASSQSLRLRLNQGAGDFSRAQSFEVKLRLCSTLQYYGLLALTVATACLFGLLLGSPYAILMVIPVVGVVFYDSISKGSIASPV